jgi:hypothetical protein
MSTGIPTSPAEILDDVIQPIEPVFIPEFARLVLSLHLSEPVQEHIRELLLRNNSGDLDPANRKQLDNYLLVGQFLDLMQAKARVALHGHESAS